MRMRPKKNRVSRLEAVNDMLASFDDGKIDIKNTFADSSRPLHLELGCGKGGFASQLAVAKPDVNILAVEKVPDVILMAMEKAKRMGDDAKNLRFANLDIDGILEVMPEHSADAIYINFCDPWPKKRNAKRRLTSPLFLEKYKKLMKDGARIFFKTDNFPLFEYSLVTFADAGYTLENVCFDLHNDEALNSVNLRTEYEENFSAKGFTINYLEAYLSPR